MRVLCINERWEGGSMYFNTYTVMEVYGERHPTNRSDKRIYYYYHLFETGPTIGFRVEQFVQIDECEEEEVSAEIQILELTN